MSYKKYKPLEINTLNQFAVVANSQTITQAAQRLGISQSAVSQTIKQLEEQTEVELIVRRSKPIKLTPSGEILLRYAQRMLSDSNRVINDIKMAANGYLSHLRVGMVDSFADALGLEFIQATQPFTKRVTLHSGMQNAQATNLHHREIDVLITSDMAERDRGLVHHTLFRDPFLVIAPENSNPQQSVSELAAKTPFIHYLKNSRIGAQTDLIARRLTIELDTLYEVDSTQTLLRFVQAGMGWAIVTALCIVPYPALLKGVRLINISDGAHARYISLLSRKRELADMPERLAGITQTLFEDTLCPRLFDMAPWLREQAYATSTMQ